LSDDEDVGGEGFDELFDDDGDFSVPNPPSGKNIGFGPKDLAKFLDIGSTPGDMRKYLCHNLGMDEGIVDKIPDDSIQAVRDSLAGAIRALVSGKKMTMFGLEVDTKTGKIGVVTSENLEDPKRISGNLIAHDMLTWKFGRTAAENFNPIIMSMLKRHLGSSDMGTHGKFDKDLWYSGACSIIWNTCYLMLALFEDDFQPDWEHVSKIENPAAKMMMIVSAFMSVPASREVLPLCVIHRKKKLGIQNDRDDEYLDESSAHKFIGKLFDIIVGGENGRWRDCFSAFDKEQYPNNRFYTKRLGFRHDREEIFMNEALGNPEPTSIDGPILEVARGTYENVVDGKHIESFSDKEIAEKLQESVKSKKEAVDSAYKEYEESLRKLKKIQKEVTDEIDNAVEMDTKESIKGDIRNAMGGEVPKSISEFMGGASVVDDGAISKDIESILDDIDFDEDDED